MELIVFDLDGTLLDASSQISTYTRDTLALLAARGIHYTVATGRTLHGARAIIDGRGFVLPQAYKNGVLIWRPDQSNYSHHHFLTHAEIKHVVEAVHSCGVTPFLSTLEPGFVHRVYHPPLRHGFEKRLANHFAEVMGIEVLPASRLPGDAEITSISALAPAEDIETVERLVENEPDLVAYAGLALEGEGLGWIDIHHRAGSKGNAVDLLREELGAQRVLVFGDSSNDLSMFATADEAYAPSNAQADVRAAATQVIGHHDEDGIAHFLRERFELR